MEAQGHRLVDHQAAQLGADIDGRFVAGSVSGWTAKFERGRDQRVSLTDRPSIQVERPDMNRVWLAEHVPGHGQPHDQEQTSQRPGQLRHVQLVDAAAVDVDLAVGRHRRVIAQGENAYCDPFVRIV